MIVLSHEFTFVRCEPCDQSSGVHVWGCRNGVIVWWCVPLKVFLDSLDKKELEDRLLDFSGRSLTDAEAVLFTEFQEEYQKR